MARFKECKEKNSGQIVVETAGFRPLGVIIHTLEVAGEQLAMRRAEEFVYGDDNNEELEIVQADQEYVDTDADALLDLHGQLLLPEPKESGDKSGADRPEQAGKNEVELAEKEVDSK